VVPEINGECTIGAKLIANPNCTTAIGLMALWPLHKLFKLKKVIMSVRTKPNETTFCIICVCFRGSCIYVTLLCVGVCVPDGCFCYNIFLMNRRIKRHRVLVSQVWTNCKKEHVPFFRENGRWQKIKSLPIHFPSTSFLILTSSWRMVIPRRK
jgi:hypothetical protein